MSDDPFDSDEWRDYAERVRNELVPKIEGTAIAVSLVTGTVDPKIAIETGYMILLDKPIIVAVTPGAKVPAKLALVADEIVEIDLDNAVLSSRRLGEAVERIMRRNDSA